MNRRYRKTIIADKAKKKRTSKNSKKNANGFEVSIRFIRQPHCAAGAANFDH